MQTYTDQVRRNDTIRHYHNVNYACHTTHWSQLHGALQGWQNNTRDDAIVVATAAACVRTSAADAHYWKIYDGPKKGSLSHEK